MRIAVYGIARNEAHHVARFLENAREADVVLVADTGSSDETAAALRGGGAVVQPITVLPWRFEVARNAALALVPPDIDLCLSLDMDEVLNPGWRAALEAGWQEGATRARYRYVGSHRPDGSAAAESLGDKLHARFGYRWRYPCHETLVPDRIEERIITLEGVQVDHWPDRGKDRSSYLELLEVAVAEDPESARDALLLGREYGYRRRWGDAEAQLRRFLALPRTVGKPQWAEAMRALATARTEQGDPADALVWLERARDVLPRARETWLAIAETQARLARWAESYDAAATALTLPLAKAAGLNPQMIEARVHDALSEAAARLGRPEEALAQAEAAARLDRSNKTYREKVKALGSGQ